MADNPLDQTSILLVVRFSRPGNRRKVDPGLVEVDADRSALSVGKELLDCEEFTKITALDGAIRRWIYSRSLPSGLLKTGVYRLPISLVEEADEALSELQERRVAMIRDFLTVYPVKAQDARYRLRALYDERDYPPVDQVASAFSFEWRYATMGVPQALSAKMLAREREKAQRDIASEIEDIRLALRTSFAELVQHAADRLAPASDGKPRIFRDSLVRNMEDFLEYFRARNIAGDDQLAALVDQARSVLHGVTPDELRSQDDLRREVAQTMASIKQTMDDNMMLRPTRVFTLGPKEATA